MIKTTPVEFNAALWAAMSAIPMMGDGETYRQRLADFENGYNAGHKRAIEECANVVRSLARKPT